LLEDEAYQREDGSQRQEPTTAQQGESQKRRRIPRERYKTGVNFLIFKNFGMNPFLCIKII
jgi:hypothetical protein